MVIGLLVAFVRFIISFTIVWAGKFAVMVLAPIAALPPFVRTAEENQVTGYPSQFPGKERAFLVSWLLWMQTHDDCLDAFWYAKRHGRWIDKYTQEYFDTHWWLRYYCYVAWLWRNPAYDLAHSLGFYHRGRTVVKFRDPKTWRLPVNDYAYWIVRNGRGQWAFEFRAQWAYSAKRYFEVRLGWGVFRESPRDLGMVYVRVIPFKKR